jgi:phosphatidylserine decarboxylase
VSGWPRALERAFATAVSAPLLSRVTGWLADRPLPPLVLRRLILAYSRVYGVDLSEVAEPIGAFRTFGGFFTRALREGSRPIDGRPSVVVSPTDSLLRDLGTVPPEGRLEQIKGQTYSLEALLGSAAAADPFRGGAHATLYLSPAMYHRVHSPVDGRIVAWSYVPGRLFPVNAPAVRSVPQLFSRNERVALFLETDDLGAVAVVLVGAANVGRITLRFAPLATNSGAPDSRGRPEPPLSVRRGEELGAFNLGSTVVILVAHPDLEPAGVTTGTLVRMGQALWRR